MNMVNGFKVTEDSFTDDVEVLFKEILNGRYVIGCECRTEGIAFQDVYHYTKSKSNCKNESFETYYIIADGKKRRLGMQQCFYLEDGFDESLLHSLMEDALKQYDCFYIDKYGSLDKKNIFTEHIDSAFLI